MPEYSADTPTAFFTASALGDQPLPVVSFFGREGLNQLFHYDIRLDQAADRGDPQELLLAPASLRLDAWTGQGTTLESRTISGIISEVTVSTDARNHGVWKLRLVPTLWRLTQTRLSRIFQDLSVQDIVSAVLGDDGQVAFEFKLNGSRATTPRPYCVQYQETNFDFVLRLLEEEGLFFSITQGDVDTVVIRDNLAKLPESTPLLEVPWEAGGTTASPNLEKVHRVEALAQAQPQTIVARDYDYNKPATDLTSESPVQSGHVGQWTEYRDAVFTEPGDGDALAQIIGEEHTGAIDGVRLGTSYRSATAGGLFKIAQKQAFPPLPFDLEGKSLAALEVESIYEHNHFENAIWARACNLPWRPQRTRPRPRISGLQTAFVVGTSGEVMTEEIGRVKVQFHWDKDFPGAAGETSCWIRVAQAHAGADHGTYFVPKIGDEVVVAFEEGDPDRPLVVGSVYNSEAEFPLEIGDQDLRAIMKTTHGFTAFVDDADGAQELHVESISDAHDFVFRCGKEIKTEAEQDITVTGQKKITVDGAEDITVTGQMPIVINGQDSIEIAGLGGGSITISQGSGKITIDSAGNIAVEGINIDIKASANLTLQAGGMVTVQGTLIKLN